MIHPTAIVAPEARLGRNVCVGPYAVVEAGAEVGEDCVIEAHAVVRGSVRMGRGNRVGVGAVLGGDPQDLRFDVRTPTFLELGESNRVGEHCTLHRGTQAGGATVVGNGCFLMVGAHVGHDSRLSDHVILANGVMLGGFVEIGERVFLGGGTTVHQFVKVGALAIAQGNSSLSKSVPPYTMVALLNRVVGLNIVGMRRAGLNAASRAEVKQAFHLLYRSALNVQQAMAEAEGRAWSPEAKVFWEFISQRGKRGLCSWEGIRRALEPSEHEAF